MGQGQGQGQKVQFKVTVRAPVKAGVGVWPRAGGRARASDEQGQTPNDRARLGPVKARESQAICVK